METSGAGDLVCIIDLRHSLFLQPSARFAVVYPARHLTSAEQVERYQSTKIPIFFAE